MKVSDAVCLLVVNIVGWFILHFAISAICFKIPLRYLLKDIAFFRIASWEGNGRIWNRLFLVKKWKRYLIDGSYIVKKSFNKSHLHGTKHEDLIIFAAETKRAELTHWLLMFPAPFFFLWNPYWAGWIIIAYALLANIPFIITQRYNRGRIESIVK
ncbi:glycosyl-4,4'-diaponeurosporenoate acyltransferase [Fredinandcohnia sp. QZ13]|uniref:glycosyl-4,4'-diaponeurosporenoate acyltransferase CrtO family protein n=1 Tax=Fredinandcohnia sp. QZ13 TaxID=3073144 RepID=UPI00285345C7|nr:glycosyl-4,4'-diaponeurosporenoate acyltransferase [Fredinandcohnia sp. QZ13]MDR4890452.1 glycosyl-4,4'-diaponeurosporenoate acyltransferase [Fredinandcohnia sp. QZ13]